MVIRKKLKNCWHIARKEQTNYVTKVWFTSHSPLWTLFFIDKIDIIGAQFPLLEANLSSYSFLSMDSIMPRCTTSLYNFDRVADTERLKNYFWYE